MKSIKKLLVLSLFTGFMGVSNAQITNAVQPEFSMGPTVVNTGIALCPGYDLNAFVFDAGFGSWRIYWVEGATGIIKDVDANSGSDPDVAYYSNYKATYVTFERAGVIYVDEFFLGVPIPNYTRNATYPIFSGRYPNIDINSSNRGVLSWERGNDIYACTFSVAPFAMGPVVQVGTNAKQPDIIALDDNNRVALTYIDIPSGRLVVETMSYAVLAGGVHAPINLWTYPPTTYYEYPRIAGQRNSISGSLSDFAVVAQDFNGVGVDVRGVFVQNAVTPSAATLINNGLQNCQSGDPRPVVAFNGKKPMTPSPTPVPQPMTKVDIEWSQYYYTSCTPIPFSGGSKDVLLAEFNMVGNNLNGPIAYNEVNQIQSDFPFVSRHSINAVYDGDFPLTAASCWREGTVFNDSGRMFWKERNCGNPLFINAPNEFAASQVTFSLVTSPVNETIEVVSADDAPASFELYDNSGRLLELREISANGNNYRIDIGHLSGGTYLLVCSSAAGDEVLRVMQVNR